MYHEKPCNQRLRWFSHAVNDIATIYQLTRCEAMHTRSCGAQIHNQRERKSLRRQGHHFVYLPRNWYWCVSSIWGMYGWNVKRFRLFGHSSPIGIHGYEINELNDMHSHSFSHITKALPRHTTPHHTIRGFLLLLPWVKLFIHLRLAAVAFRSITLCNCTCHMESNVIWCTCALTMIRLQFEN